MNDSREQRAAIAIRVSAILGQFWTDDTPDDLRAIEMEGWLDVLRGISTHELRAAWADYQTTGPRSASGRLARPDAGALYQRAMKARANAMIIDKAHRLPPPEPPPRERVTDEARAAIMRDVWGRDGAAPTFTPKSMPAIGEGDCHD